MEPLQPSGLLGEPAQARGQGPLLGLGHGLDRPPQRAVTEHADRTDELAPPRGEVDLDAAAVVVPAVTADQAPVLQTVKESGRRGGGQSCGCLLYTSRCV